MSAPSAAEVLEALRPLAEAYEELVATKVRLDFYQVCLLFRGERSHFILGSDLERIHRVYQALLPLAPAEAHDGSSQLELFDK